MSEEISFVEVLMVSYKLGDKEYSDFLDNEISLCSIPWKDATEEIPEVIEAREKTKAATKKSGFATFPLVHFNAPDLLVTQPFCAFRFRFFGQGFDMEYASGIDWECSATSCADVFEGWEDELIKLGQSVINDKKSQGLDFSKLNDGKFVRFVTLWSYSSFVDSYNNEFDSEWDLIGLVNPDSINESRGG